MLAAIAVTDPMLSCSAITQKHLLSTKWKTDPWLEAQAFEPSSSLLESRCFWVRACSCLNVLYKYVTIALFVHVPRSTMLNDTLEVSLCFVACQHKHPSG